MKGGPITKKIRFNGMVLNTLIHILIRWCDVLVEGEGRVMSRRHRAGQATDNNGQWGVRQGVRSYFSGETIGEKMERRWREERGSDRLRRGNGGLSTTG